MTSTSWLFLFSVLANVFGIVAMRWLVRRTRPLVNEFIKLRDAQVEQNKKLAMSNDMLIQTGTQLIAAQTQLGDALRQAEHYRREADHYKQVHEISERVAASKIAAAEIRAGSHGVRTVVVHVPGLDDQTKNLVRLAIDNPSPNEGAAAALIVCKRLKEQIQ